MWPQYTYLALVCLALGFTLAKHGKPREDNYNFWVSLPSYGITLFILYSGGFFNSMFNSN